jgi:hypothetical protein
MINLRVILMILAFILFVLAGLNVPAPRVNLVAFGLACWVLALIVTVP